MVEERGFSSKEAMNECLINQINRTVKPGELLYHLGDLSFAGWRRTQTITEQLHCDLKIVPGNHDSESELRKLSTKFGPVELLPPLKRLKFERPDGPIRITLCHYPMRTWDKAHHGAVHLHGHSHGSCQPIGKMLDVGVDGPMSYNFTPVSLDIVEGYMALRSFEKIDHHEPGIG